MATMQVEVSYLRVSAQPVARTVELDGGLLVDVDAESRVVGIERIGGVVDGDSLMTLVRSAVLPEV